MKRAAIYARFSSDLQRDRSIEDQLALGRETAKRLGAAVVREFSDRGISGSSVVNRPGFQAMMAAAKAGEFSILIVEDVDRMSRDQADYHEARRWLDFAGIAIHTAGGKVGKIDGALRALMGETFIENLAVHTHRGLSGVVRDGRHAGGRAYGYRALPGEERGRLEIVEEEAAIVRRIFADYVAGRTPRQIAIRLNTEGVAAPRASAWNASTINGNRARKSGMLFNELYIGRIVWNRQKFEKAPGSRKRVSRLRDEGDVVTVAAPHLRIIDDATWNAAQAIKRTRHAEHFSRGRAPARVLSGLIKCGSCGSGMTSVARDKKGMRLQCSAHRERGTCGNGRMVYRSDIERTVIDSLRGIMADRTYLAAFVDEYNAERKRLARSGGAERARLERRAGEIARELGRAVDAIVKAGIDPATLAGRIRDLEAEKATVAAALAGLKEATVVSLHPAAIERYKTDLGRLAGLLDAGDGKEPDADLIAAVRGLLSSVVVTASPGRGPVHVEIRGCLGELTAVPAFPARSMGGGLLVAGARNRQSPTEPTFVIHARAA